MPSVTIRAPEFRTANRSPTRPRRYSSPSVAPYPMVFPAMTWVFTPGAWDGEFSSGRTMIRPPDSPLPT